MTTTNVAMDRKITERPEWWLDKTKNCYGFSPDIFFPEVESKGGRPCADGTRKYPNLDDTQRYIGNYMCNGLGDSPFSSPCPVRTDCAVFAMKNALLDGVWGGLSAAQRKTIRRKASALWREKLEEKYEEIKEEKVNTNITEQMVALR